MSDRELVGQLGEPCTVAGRAGRGLAWVTRGLVDMTTDADTAPVLRREGQRECRGGAQLEAFASLSEMLDVMSDGPVEYDGPVRENGDVRHTQARVLVTNAAEDGWVEFVATGPVP